MDINLDVTLPGEKLAIRLWETVDNIICDYLKPINMKRIKLAELENMRLELMHNSSIKTGVKSNKNKIEPHLDIAGLNNSISHQKEIENIRKEINVLHAIIVAEKDLQNSKNETPDQKVDMDWLFKWKDYASETSKEDIQTLWGKILANEIKEPGSFSLKTLNILSYINSSVAKKFTKLCEFVIEGRTISRAQLELIREDGISDSDLFNLQYLNLISGVDSIATSYRWDCAPFNKVLTVGKFGLGIKSHDIDFLVISAINLTEAGKEIYNLIEDIQGNKEYLKQVAITIKKENQGVINFEIGEVNIINETSMNLMNYEIL